MQINIPDKAAHNKNIDNNCPDQEEDVEFLIIYAYTLSNPRAMMIHSQDTPI